MGLACPVCEDPQSDARHLANHLGFTAVVRGGDHEAWLDEHVPDWGEMDEASLAERVVDDAEAVHYPQVFEDTTGRHDHDQDGRGPERATAADLPVDVAGIDDVEGDADEIIEEARELTRRRREDSETE